MSTKYSAAGIRKLVWKKFYILYGCLPGYTRHDKWTEPYPDNAFLTDEAMQKKLVEIYMHHTLITSEGRPHIWDERNDEWSLRETLTIGGLYEHSERVWKAMQSEGLAADWPEHLVARRIRYITHHKPHGLNLRSVRTTPRGGKVPTRRIFLPYLPYKPYQVENLLARMLPLLSTNLDPNKINEPAE